MRYNIWVKVALLGHLGAAEALAVNFQLPVSNAALIVYGLDGLRSPVGRQSHLSSSRQLLPRLATPSGPPTSIPTATTMAEPEPASWDGVARTACAQALDLLKGQTTSKSGIAMCYNVPYLNNGTGAFSADLRLVRVAPPSGNWTGLGYENMQMKMDFDWAMVNTTAPNEAQQLTTRAILPSRSNDTSYTMMLLQSFNITGKMYPNMLTKPMDLSQLQRVLSPNVTLTATNQKGRNMSSFLSVQEASFLVGVMGQPASTLSANTIAGQNAPFILPGMTLGIFPVGLIITASWAVIGMLVVGLGTLHRYQFRQSYRRRLERTRTALKRVDTL